MAGITFNRAVQWLAIPCAVSWSKKSKMARKMTEGHMQCISSKLALRKGFRHLSVRLQRGWWPLLRQTARGALLPVPSAPIFAPVRRQGRSTHAGIQDANSARWKPFPNKVAALC